MSSGMNGYFNDASLEWCLGDRTEALLRQEVQTQSRFALNRTSMILITVSSQSPSHQEHEVEYTLVVILGTLIIIDKAGHCYRSLKDLSLIGDAGALGSTIYGVATDPDSAILDIFEIALMGGDRSPEEFEEAANARRGLTDDEISSQGSDWKSWSDGLSDVRSVCY
ncbi:hypothetical protein AbraIFM66951_002935 [Aspergillus brasiliensis]|uniref:Uncharacterized protein n=1 Tax=Aspergillus brasiliensis TaxID=319629 RepID=A0A9W5YUN1_9EURO|nr:hypothetical protein AbraCBS73388_008555 [Aspergillus brasiliensis]GKZ50088.1 hypothetical protein AbraIFM66951_002935 [Aspergillus brasiliensis]